MRADQQKGPLAKAVRATKRLEQKTEGEPQNHFQGKYSFPSLNAVIKIELIHLHKTTTIDTCMS